MEANRRGFLQIVAGASAGSLLSACSGGGDAATSDSISPTSAQNPTPPPAPGDPPDPPAPTAPPAPVPNAIDNLKAFLQQSAVPNFALPNPATAVPLISWAGGLATSGEAATTLPNGLIFSASSSLIGGPVRKQLTATLPGNPTIVGYPCLAVSRPYSCKGQARTVSSPTVLHLKTDAAVIELAGVIADGSPFGTIETLIIDGQLTPPRVLSSGLGGGGWDVGAVRIDFGSHALRDIWIRTSLYVAYIKIDQGDSLLPADDDSLPQITVVGDSYQQKPSAAYGDNAIALEIGARLGIYKVAVDAIGGTGYWDTGGDLGNLIDRLPAHASDDSTIYLVMAGLNDYGDATSSGLTYPSLADYEAGVSGYFKSLREARPDSLIVVTAPFCPVPPMSDSTYIANPQSNTSGLGDFLLKAQVQKAALEQIDGPWIYIDVLMGTGWLNSSGASGDVTNLQWFTGGTPAPGTSANYKPGNTQGGGGGGFGGIVSIPLLTGGQYTQAPDVTASGGSGSGLLLASSIDASGTVTAINVVSPGSNYSSGAGLPTIALDPIFQVSPATVGEPVLMTGVNPDGCYPLPAFAPPGSSADLNNIYVMLMDDLTHPSPVGVSYLSTRLAQTIYDGLMAL